jgi:hypothetical protein
MRHQVVAHISCIAASKEVGLLSRTTAYPAKPCWMIAAESDSMNATAEMRAFLYQTLGRKDNSSTKSGQ